MGKRVCWLVLYTFCVKMAFGQQWGSTYVLHNRNINSIVLLNPQNITISGGSDYNDAMEAVFHCTDFGLNWNESPVDTFGFVVRSLAFSDTMHGFGSGFFGNFVRTSDGGVTWPRDTLPIKRNFFKAIYATPTKAFLAGGEELGANMQTILRSDDACTSWTVLRDTAGPVLRSIYFMDSLKGCAVGDTGTILRTTDGGNTWLPVPSPVQMNFNSMAFVNADTGYIVGGQNSPDSTRVILQTLNGGASWTVLKNEPGAWLTDISFTNKDTGYIVGYLATFLVTTDGGQTWNRQAVTNATGGEYFTSVRFYDRSFGVIGSLFGQVFVYADPPKPEVKTTNVVFGMHNAQPTLTLTGMTNTYGADANLAFIVSPDSFTATSLVTPYPVTVNTASLSTVGYDISSSLAAGIYFYACRITNTSGSFYGDTVKFVMPDSVPVLNALPYTNANITSLTLAGNVVKLPAGANVYFEYSISGDTVIHTVPATPGTINDSLTHNVSANITGIIPRVQYQYRVKATKDAEVFYSDYLQFNLGSGSINLNTLAATDVTINSALLNGQVDHLPLSSTIWFEYMLNGVITTVPAIPSVVSDTLSHNISAQLNDLVADNRYRFRLKVVIDTTVVLYGNYFDFYTANNILAVDSEVNSGSNFVSLYGHVANVHFPAQLAFTYWTGPYPKTTVQAIPGNINDTLSHLVSTQVYNLQPNTFYNCNLLLFDSSGYMQSSDVFQFYTGKGFKMFPNPSSSLVALHIFGENNGQLEVYDMQGRMVYSATFSGNEQQLDTRLFNEGVYLVRIRSGKDDMTQKLVIIQ